MHELTGLRIVVTRARHQREQLAALLRAREATVLFVSAIGIAAPGNEMPLRVAAVNAGTYDWIVLSSVNAVKAFASRLESPCTTPVAAVGSSTRDAAVERGLNVKLVPPTFTAEALVDSFAAVPLGGKRVLIPSAAQTRGVIAPALESLGAQVEVVEAYRNVIPPEAAQEAATVFVAPFPNWITIASSSAVDNLVSITGSGVLSQSKIASIGPIVTRSAVSAGLQVAAEAQPHTIVGLVEAICAYERSH